VRFSRAWIAAAHALSMVALLLPAGCSSPAAEDTSEASEIAAARAAKDAVFERSPDSPVPQHRRAELLPLSYFPFDPAYGVPAALKPSTDDLVVQMPTSAGTERQMRRVGTLEFTLKGQPMQLTAFVEVGSPDVDRLFVPFTDLTTGAETYAAGRYLDLDRNATGLYEVDFNRAYQPFCYFDPTFDCPYPPAENRLKVPIRAGERLKTANR
jgi:uncharacterized protein